ncbi:RNase A-like domain-containing protein [Lysinibacillus sphaericus]|uniref:RNase A-like domain-containing protein n=1 Tax=Lysinibacillus sphaericus TaxID=1421 RepID=UPI0038300A5A
MVRSIPGSKQFNTYVTNSSNLTRGLGEMAAKKISNASTSNSSTVSKHIPKRVINDSRSSLENAVRSHVTNIKSNSSSNNSTSIRSDSGYQIVYNVDSSSIGGTTLNNLYSTNTMDGVRIASLDTVEISDESRQLYVAKSSNKYMDIAETVFDVATDFIPLVGTAKDIYNAYKTIVDPKSKVEDIALALVDLIPGPSVSKIKKFADVIIDKYDLNASAARKLNNALVKTSAAKIKEMDINDTKKLINASEGKNLPGHTKEKHLNITDEELQARSKTKNRQGASKFSNHKVMQEFVNTVLVDEADRIASWLKNTKDDEFVSRKHKSTTPLGYGYKYNAKERTIYKSDKLDTGIVVLQRDDSNDYGFVVKTAYPFVK